MENFSDSDKTNDDPSESSPRAKESFFSEPAVSQKSVLLQSDSSSSASSLISLHTGVTGSLESPSDVTDDSSKPMSFDSHDSATSILESMEISTKEKQPEMDDSSVLNVTESHISNAELDAAIHDESYVSHPPDHNASTAEDLSHSEIIDTPSKLRLREENIEIDKMDSNDQHLVSHGSNERHVSGCSIRSNSNPIDVLNNEKESCKDSEIKVEDLADSNDAKNDNAEKNSKNEKDINECNTIAGKDFDTISLSSGSPSILDDVAVRDNISNTDKISNKESEDARNHLDKLVKEKVDVISLLSDSDTDESDVIDLTSSNNLAKEVSNKKDYDYKDNYDTFGRHPVTSPSSCRYSANFINDPHFNSLIIAGALGIGDFDMMNVDRKDETFLAANSQFQVDKTYNSQNPHYNVDRSIPYVAKNTENRLYSRKANSPIKPRAVSHSISSAPITIDIIDIDETKVTQKDASNDNKTIVLDDISNEKEESVGTCEPSANKKLEIETPVSNNDLNENVSSERNDRQGSADNEGIDVNETILLNKTEINTDENPPAKNKKNMENKISVLDVKNVSTNINETCVDKGTYTRKNDEDESIVRESDMDGNISLDNKESQGNLGNAGINLLLDVNNEVALLNQSKINSDKDLPTFNRKNLEAELPILVPAYINESRTDKYTNTCSRKNDKNKSIAFYGGVNENAISLDEGSSQEGSDDVGINLEVNKDMLSQESSDDTGIDLLLDVSRELESAGTTYTQITDSSEKNAEILPNKISVLIGPQAYPSNYESKDEVSSVIGRENTDANMKNSLEGEVEDFSCNKNKKKRRQKKKKRFEYKSMALFTNSFINFESPTKKMCSQVPDNSKADVTKEQAKQHESEPMDIDSTITTVSDYKPPECNAEESTDAPLLRSFEQIYSHPPKQVAASFKEFQSRRENHLRGCLWSPDGTSILTNSDDNVLRLFRIPDDLVEMSLEEELCADLKMTEGESIYDMDWYPYMDTSQPDTCCFLSTSRDHPIHLWDSGTGQVRCSYRAYNQLDELSSPHSLSFNADGSKIYCGFDKLVRIFDSARPGTQCTERNTVAKKNQSRKGKVVPTLNQPGIISSIAFSCSYHGLYALGSFSKTVGLYDANDGSPLFLLRGHTGGVTQVKFTEDGFYLMSGARKDAEILWWDIRNTSTPLFKLLREVSTNQRIQFDIDRYGFQVFSGSTNKMINMWDLKSILDENQGEVALYKPTYQFCAHGDAVNAVCLHPSKPLLASTSGQRHFYIDSDSDGTGVDVSQTTKCFDNSLKIWKLE